MGKAEYSGYFMILTETSTVIVKLLRMGRQAWRMITYYLAQANSNLHLFSFDCLRGCL
jgi:hypothetical protein